MLVRSEGSGTGHREKLGSMPPCEELGQMALPLSPHWVRRPSSILVHLPTIRHQVPLDHHWEEGLSCHLSTPSQLKNGAVFWRDPSGQHFRLYCRLWSMRHPTSFLELFLTPLWEWASSHSWLLLNLNRANWVVIGDAEKTQDRQTDRKLGPDLLGTQVEMHNAQYFFSLMFSSFYSTSFLHLYSLRPYSFTIL
jgi:hypothetical protein